MPQQGFPGSPLVKNLPDDAGDTHSVPASAGSHMPPELELEPVLHSRRSHGSEKLAHRNSRVAPLAAARESLCTATDSAWPKKKK